MSSLKIEIGGMRHMDGWICLDNRHNDFNIITDEIPVPDESVEYFYMSHVIEHIPLPCAESVFKKIYKKLKPGGKIRIVCPDLEIILKAYMDKNIDIFNNDLYQLGTVPQFYKKLGIGACVLSQINTATIGDENDSYLFTAKENGKYICTFSHISGWDFEMIKNLFENLNFCNVERTEHETIDPHNKLGQLFVNAYK